MGLLSCKQAFQTGAADMSARRVMTNWECGVIRCGLFTPATHGLREPVIQSRPALRKVEEAICAMR